MSSQRRGGGGHSFDDVQTESGFLDPFWDSECVACLRTELAVVLSHSTEFVERLTWGKSSILECSNRLDVDDVNPNGERTSLIAIF